MTNNGTGTATNMTDGNDGPYKNKKSFRDIINYKGFSSRRNIKTLMNSPIFCSTSIARKALNNEQLRKIAVLYLRTNEDSEDWGTPFFDSAYYCKLLKMKSMKTPKKLMLHYIKAGWKFDLDPHPLISTGYYKDQAARKEIAINIEPIKHYIEDGYKKNLSLCQYFDNDWYRKQNNTDDFHLSPFEHFLTEGSEQLSDPSPMFSMNYLRQTQLKYFHTTAEAIYAYARSCFSHDVMRTHPLFDDVYYRENNPDVEKSGMTPVAHYTSYGFDEGRKSIDLAENKADQTSAVDSLQFKFIETTSYFQKKELASKYGTLEELRRQCAVLQNDETPRPLAIITCFNDQDCIESIIKAGVREGLSFWIIDNWSSDGTWEKLESLKNHDVVGEHIEKLERYPASGPSDHYDWAGMLRHKEQIAKDYVGRWILHQDSDEITVSLFPNVTAAKHLYAVQALGYNCVNMRMLDFRPTDFQLPGPDIEEHFKYFEFSHKPAYGVQIKAWLQGETQVDLSSTGGHEAKFINRKIFPLRLPRKHYAIRSVAHGRKKIFLERKPRFQKERNDLGWHTHYDDAIDDASFIWEQRLLTEYIPNGHVSVWFDMLFHGDE